MRVPTVKLRFLRTRRFTMGSATVSSRQMNAAMAASDRAVVAQIQVAANQSSSCPLSRTSWSEPSHNAMAMKPA